MSKLGVMPQQIAGGDLYPALEKGAIDAAEWVGPYDDEKLRFVKVAPFTTIRAGGRLARSSLSTSTSSSGNRCRRSTRLRSRRPAPTPTHTVARYDAGNPPALRRLVGAGAIVKPFPRDVLLASYKAAFEVYEETAAKNPRFRKVYEAWSKFRADEDL